MNPVIKKYSPAFLAYVILGIFVTFPLILKMNNGIYGPFYATDVRGAIWHLWWLKYSYLHGLNENFCPFISAPFGYDFSKVPLLNIALIFSRFIVVLTSPVFFWNLSALACLVLSGFFTYLLVMKLTGHQTSSFISGAIFAFSPYHLNKLIEFGYVYIGAGIVLYLYLLLRFNQTRRLTYGFWAILTLAVMASFNMYYAYFSVLLTVAYAVFLLFFQWRNSSFKVRLLRNLNFFAMLAGILAGAVLLNAPSLYRIVKILFFNAGDGISLNPAAYYIRDLHYVFSQSARPLSYLLPASTHPIFGKFTEKMFGSIFYGRGAIEQTLYLGWAPLILSFLAYRHWKNRRLQPTQYPSYAASGENFYIGLFLFLGVFAVIFSMPPYIDLIFIKLYSPTYLLHKILPMFRAYARLGVVVTLCVSVLAGFSLKHALESIRSFWARSLFLSAACLFIAFEFTNVPPFRVTDIYRPPDVYKWLAKEDGDFIIAEYPMSTCSPGEAQENYDYFFYQTLHQKKMINGAMPGTKAFEIKNTILKVDNRHTAGILKSLGVRYVIIHNDLYKSGEYEDSVDIIGVAPRLEAMQEYKLIGDFGNDQVFEVVAAPINPEEYLHGKEY